MLAVMAGSLALTWLLPGRWQIGWQTAFALAGAMAMSSTAIVAKMLADRLEVL